MRRLMALGTFMTTSMKLVHEMSLEDGSQLTEEKSQLLFGQPGSLKLRTDGYTWYQTHKSNSNYVSIKPKGRQTQVPGCETLWVVPSSATSQEFSLKELARAITVDLLMFEDVSVLEIPQSLKNYLREYHYKSIAYICDPIVLDEIY